MATPKNNHNHIIQSYRWWLLFTISWRIMVEEQQHLSDVGLYFLVSSQRSRTGQRSAETKSDSFFFRCLDSVKPGPQGHSNLGVLTGRLGSVPRSSCVGWAQGHTLQSEPLPTALPSWMYWFIIPLNYITLPENTYSWCQSYSWNVLLLIIANASHIHSL